MGVELDALRLLDGGRMWVKSVWVDKEGRMCLDGALQLAAGITPCSSGLGAGPRATDDQLRAYNDAFGRVREAIRARVGRPHASLTSWNDSQRRFRPVAQVLIEADRLSRLPQPPVHGRRLIRLVDMPVMELATPVDPEPDPEPELMPVG